MLKACTYRSQGANLKKWLLANAVALAVALLLSGCTTSNSWPDAGGESDWSKVDDEKPQSWRPDIPDASLANQFIVPAVCNNSVVVIGVGNPGHGNKVDRALSYAAEQIGISLLDFTQPVPQGNIPVSTVEVSYPGATRPITDVMELKDARDTFGLPAARDSLIKEIDRVDLKCPGTQIVITGHGRGAAVVREAARVMGEYRAERISAVWLSSDPNRDPAENVAVVAGTPDLGVLDSAEVVDGDPTAGGVLPYAGIDGVGAGLSETVQGKTITSCYYSDPVCNATPDFQRDPVKYFAEHDGRDQVNTNHQIRAVGLALTEPASEWVTKHVRADIAQGSRSLAAPDMTPELASYLNYVNSYIDTNDGLRKKHPGPTVIQDVKMTPGIVSTCSDYTVIGARGSGQQIEGNDLDGDQVKVFNDVGFNGGKPSQQNAPVIDGFTEFPATYAWEVKRNLPSNKTIRFIPIQYVAVGLDWQNFIPDAHTGGGKANETFWGMYFDSVRDGVKMATEMVKAVATKCKDTTIMMTGYSQGGQVIHETVSNLQEQYADRIGAVLLIADASFYGSDGLPRWYEPRHSPWVFNAEDSVLTASTNGISLPNLSFRFFPEHYKDKIVQVCDSGDLVCNSVEIIHKSSAGEVHTSAYRKSTHYQFPSNWAAEQLVKHQDG